MGRATAVNTHSITSTWPLADKSTWNWGHRLIHLLNAYPIIPGKPLPVHPKTDRLPYMGQTTQHIFVLLHASLPLLLNQAWVSLTGNNFGAAVAVIFYTLGYTRTAVQELKMLRRLTHTYGCLDGDVQRDGIPNTGVFKIMGEMYKTAGFRMIMAALLSWDAGSSPLAVASDWRWWVSLLAKLTVHGVILDFFFYTYHRSCHEIPRLWMYHRTHHLTKHPTAILSGFADDEQEIMEIMIVPFLTYLTMRTIGLQFGFYDWWICFQYLTFTEIFGHSGLRVSGAVVSPITPLLTYFNLELVTEDHDLHHRKGWKKSFNYGKQTRVWDTLFGTKLERIEGTPDKIDYGTRVSMPLL